MIKPKKLKDFQILEFPEILNNNISSIEIGEIGDVLGNLSRVKKNTFLGRFSPEELFDLLKKTKMIDYLHKNGFDDFRITIDNDDSGVSYMKLYSGGISPDDLLVDLRLSENKFLPDKRFFPFDLSAPTYDMVWIEWLTAQNPHKNFKDHNKPQLPGQTKPGLGLLKYCFNIMYAVGREVTKDGFMDVPDHLHGAVMYSKKFKFFDPRHEAILHAILRDLKHYSLSDITWGMITETIYDTYKNTPQKYAPSEQIFALSPRLKKYFKSVTYKTIYAKYYHIKKYRFDYAAMIKKREDILRNKNVSDL
jgi:hypothetical protein